MSDKLKIGPYQVVELIGRGGMGAVYRARHELLGHEVALKVLLLGASDDDIRLARFRREAEAALSLKHPGVVRVYDYGTAEGKQYLAMELVHGATLKEVIERHVTLPVPEATTIAAQLLEALAACHEKGLLHRDVKPANVMIESTGKTRLLDLGLVKPIDRTVLTEEGAVVGTPRYMPPEMLAHGEMDHRGDIYQVAAILYECLAGRPVADAIGLMEVVEQVVNGPPPQMPVVLEHGPRGVREFLTRALAKAPAGRFESCAEALAVLRGVTSSHRLRTSGRDVRTSGSMSTQRPAGVASEKGVTEGPGGGRSPTPGAGVARPPTPDAAPSRPLPPGVRLIALAVTVASAAVALIVGIAMTRRERLVEVAIARDPAAAAARDLVVATGPAELRLTWRTDRASRGVVTLPSIGRTEREDVPRAEHRIVIDKLVPETRYELTVGDDEGGPALTQTAVTRSVAGVARELTRALVAAEPNKLSGQLRDEVVNPLKARDPRHAAAWRTRLKQKFGGEEFQQLARDFRSVRHLIAEADVPVATRAQVAQRISELEDLHEILEMTLKLDSGLKVRELEPPGLAVEEQLPPGLKPLIAVRFGSPDAQVTLPPAPRTIEAGEPMVFNAELYNLLTNDPRARTRQTFEVPGPLTTARRLERVYLGFRATQGLPVEKVQVWAVSGTSRTFLGRFRSTRGVPPPERFIRLDERPVADPPHTLQLTFSNRESLLTGVGVKVYSLVLYGETP